jgi:hypothetical protein
MQEKVIDLTHEVSAITRRGLNDVQRVTNLTKILAVNAQIEAARAGEHGRGFAIVAEEVGKISEQIKSITSTLGDQLQNRLETLDTLSSSIVREARGTRLADLSLNMIEIIDRNLYERSCDVRWWATDSAVLDALTDTSKRKNTSQRLGVILDAYTVYLDIWVADLDGKVIASGRPSKFAAALGTDVSREPWFSKALSTRTGGDFAVDDITLNSVFGSTVATYSTAVREGGTSDGRPIGVLGIFFDWQTQSQAVLNGVRFAPSEKENSRAMLLDSRGRVIASSDGRGVLSETFDLSTGGKKSGYYTDKRGNLVGFSLTPGYETYKGLGWWGAIVQTPGK